MRLHRDFEPRRNLEYLAKNGAKRHLAKRLSHHRIGNGPHGLRKMRQRYMVCQHAGIGMKPRHRVIVTLQHGGQQPSQKQPVAEIKMSHDAEINRHQRAVGRHEYVPWVHVAMEEAVTEHLIEEASRCRFGDFADVMPGSFQRFDVINPDSLDPFYDQHARGGVLEIDPGNCDSGIASHVFGKLAGGSRFQPQIKLDVGNLRELVNRGDKLEPPQIGGRPLENSRQGIEQGGVGLHAPANAGTKKLHRHPSSVDQLGLVNLCDRGCRHRLVVKLPEDLGDGPAGLCLDPPPRQRTRKGREAVLKKAE